MEEVIKTKNFELQDTAFYDKYGNFLIRNSNSEAKRFRTLMLFYRGLNATESHPSFNFINYLLTQHLNIEVLYVLERLCEE